MDINPQDKMAASQEQMVNDLLVEVCTDFNAIKPDRPHEEMLALIKEMLKSTFAMCQRQGIPIVFIDTETTGFQSHDRIVQYAALECEYCDHGTLRLKHTFSYYYDFGVESNPHAYAVHKLSRKFLEDNTVEDCSNHLLETATSTLRGLAIIFNAPFDVRMIRQSTGVEVDDSKVLDLMKVGAAVLDNQNADRKKYKNIKQKRLFEQLTGKQAADVHNGLSDCAQMLLSVNAILTLGE